MKSKEVLELLQISRPTLCKYVKEGTIKTSVVASEINFEKRKINKIKEIVSDDETSLA